MAAGDGGGQSYMEVDGKVALSAPANAAESASTGFQDAAFKYAYQRYGGGLAVATEGDRASIDAIFAIAQQYKTPPATPTLSSLAPNTALHATGPFNITLTGTGFTPGATMIFGTVVEPRVVYVSATTLTSVIYPSYIPTAGTIAVKVRPGGGAADSGSVNFTVT
jgi:hypothetical protein